jgi:microcystin-dependent protein
MSLSSKSPEEFLGGKWTRITGRFLLAATNNGNSGASQAAGNTGGEATHKLTQAELPNVTGWATAMNWWGSDYTEGTGSAGGAFSAQGQANNEYTYPTGWATNTPGRRPGNLSMSFGSNGSHNNMPPYLSVYMWKRTA